MKQKRKYEACFGTDQWQITSLTILTNEIIKTQLTVISLAFYLVKKWCQTLQQLYLFPVLLLYFMEPPMVTVELIITRQRWTFWMRNVGINNAGLLSLYPTVYQPGTVGEEVKCREMFTFPVSSGLSTVLPLAAHPIFLAGEVVRMNLSSFGSHWYWHAMDSKIFTLFMNGSGKQFQNFSKWLLGAIVIILGMYPYKHEEHEGHFSCNFFATL